MIATGCEDKCVRVFYVAASTDLPLKIFSGKLVALHATNFKNVFLPLQVFG